jgi:hypothetical protein
MAIADTLVFKVYTGLTSMLVTAGMHKLLTAGWHFVTGEEPPEPTDPDANATSAILWALSSAAGVAVAQVIAQRVGYRFLAGDRKFKARKISLKI